MDQAAHGEARHVDEETKVADIDDERRIRLRPARGELRIEEGEEFYVSAVAFGVRGIAFGVGDVVGGLAKLLARSFVLAEQNPVDDEVGIAADGRSEVG